MMEQDSSAAFHAVELSPGDVTDAEWGHLLAHWLERTDHFTLWARDWFGQVGFRRVEAFADLHPASVTHRSSGGIALTADVDQAAVDLLRELLTPSRNPEGRGWSFPQQDVRLYSGDLQFVSEHDGHSFYVFATSDEFDFYQAFGLTEREFRVEVPGHWASWTYQMNAGDMIDGPEARRMSTQPLTAEELSTRLAEIRTRHPTITVPPFSLAPIDGLAGRAFRRILAESKARFQSEIERIDDARPSMADVDRRSTRFRTRYRDRPTPEQLEDPEALVAWVRHRRATNASAVRAAVSRDALLDSVRRQGAAEALRRLGAMTFPGPPDMDVPGRDRPQRQAQDAIPGQTRDATGGDTLYLRSGNTILRSEGTLTLVTGATLILLAHFAATDGPAPDVFALAYRLEDAHGALVWQYDECPALPTPHKHLADGTVEPVERLPSPAEAAREAVAGDDDTATS